MRFWDSSAVVPLLIQEASSGAVLAHFESDPAMTVWWGTRVECIAAIVRRERERAAPLADATAAIARLGEFADAWDEVAPGEPIRAIAQRLLRVHPLRAGDALQLAAAIVAAGRDPSSLEFVCLDNRLTEAATREGFRVVSGSPA